MVSSETWFKSVTVTGRATRSADDLYHGGTLGSDTGLTGSLETTKYFKLAASGGPVLRSGPNEKGEVFGKILHAPQSEAASMYRGLTLGEIPFPTEL
jgi:hypothetical protein